MKNHIIIDDDVFEISNRLKEIDESYFVVFNFKRQKFEVHSSLQKETYCFTVPYDFLDSRTIDYARKTSSANQDKLISEIDNNNEKVEKDTQKQVVDNLKEVLE